MKPSKELLLGLDIDKYLSWTKEIYTFLPGANDVLKDFMYLYNSLLLYEFSLKSYYELRQFRNKKARIINESEVNARINRFEKLLEDRTKHRKEILQNQIKKYEDILDYGIHFIPAEKLKLLGEKRLSELFKYIEIDTKEVQTTLFMIDSWYKQEIEAIEGKAKINPTIYESRLNEGLEKDFEYLEWITEVRFNPNFVHQSQSLPLTREFSDLKVLQYLARKLEYGTGESKEAVLSGLTWTDKTEICEVVQALVLSKRIKKDDKPISQADLIKVFEYVFSCQISQPSVKLSKKALSNNYRIDNNFFVNELRDLLKTSFDETLKRSPGK
jgi:hypothetical protein